VLLEGGLQALPAPPLQHAQEPNSPGIYETPLQLSLPFGMGFQSVLSSERWR
jgi:hypothetical protein